MLPIASSSSSESFGLASASNSNTTPIIPSLFHGFSGSNFRPSRTPTSLEQVDAIAPPSMFPMFLASDGNRQTLGATFSSLFGLKDDPSSYEQQYCSNNGSTKFDFTTRNRPTLSSSPISTARPFPEEETDPRSRKARMRSLDDGYNWKKYGQKSVKGSQNTRSYYRCVHSNCPTKKKVQINGEGRITEIVYKGHHSHSKPQSSRRKRNSFTSSSSTTRSTSSIEDGIDYEDPDGKRGDSSGNSFFKHPRVIVKTTSEKEFLDDGYCWRKYGQKVVKGSLHPRSYYRCTEIGCQVRKLVERDSHDGKEVITIYEGKHNHQVPSVPQSEPKSRSLHNQPFDTNAGVGSSTMVFTMEQPSPFHNNHFAQESTGSKERNNNMPLSNAVFFQNHHHHQQQQQQQQGAPSMAMEMCEFPSPGANRDLFDMVCSLSAEQEPIDDVFFHSLPY